MQTQNMEVYELSTTQSFLIIIYEVMKRQKIAKFTFNPLCMRK